MLLEAVGIGNQPVVISVDANIAYEKSKALQRAVDSGAWVDAARETAEDKGEIPNTYAAAGIEPDMRGAGATRIDFVLCNRAAWAHFQGLQYRFDLRVPGHVLMRLTLSSQPILPRGAGLEAAAGIQAHG